MSVYLSQHERLTYLLYAYQMNFSCLNPEAADKPKTHTVGLFEMSQTEADLHNFSPPLAEFIAWWLVILSDLLWKTQLHEKRKSRGTKTRSFVSARQCNSFKRAAEAKGLMGNDNQKDEAECSLGVFTSCCWWNLPVGSAKGFFFTLSSSFFIIIPQFLSK